MNANLEETQALTPAGPATDAPPAAAGPVVPPGPDEPRWPAIASLAMSWLRPATNARRTLHVPLRRAFAVHLLAAVLTVVAVFMVAANMSFGESMSYEERLFRLISEVVEEYARWPLETTLATIFVSLLIEAGFLALALIVSPWGAIDERPRSSFGHALRVVWLHTSHALPVVVVIGLGAEALSSVAGDWHRTHPDAYQKVLNNIQTMSPPTPPAGALPGSPAWAAYLEQMNEYNRRWQRAYREYRRSQPFLVQHNDDIIGISCLTVGAWILWALLRAVGIARTAPAPARPPGCEECGYNLTGTPADGRCPECGLPVVESLGPHVRPGTAWQRRREVGLLSAWCRSTAAALFHPRRLGRQLRVFTGSVSHRSLLVANMLPAALVGMAGMLLVYVAIEGRSPIENDDEVLFPIAPIVGYAMAVGVLSFSLLASAVIGLFAGWGSGRSLLGAAMQVGASLSGGFVFLCLLSWLLGAGVAWAVRLQYGASLATTLRMPLEIVGVFTWLLPSVALLLIYLLLLYKGTAAARHGNR